MSSSREARATPLHAAPSTPATAAAFGSTSRRTPPATASAARSAWRMPARTVCASGYPAATSTSRGSAIRWRRSPRTRATRTPCAGCGRFCNNIGRKLAEGEGLWIMGHTGTGKTTLGYMVAATATRAQHSVLSFNAVALLNRLRATFNPDSHESTEQVIRTLAEVELLHIEDLRVVRPTEWVLEQLYLIVNARYEERRSIVFTSDIDSDADGPLTPNPRELAEHIGTRTFSRLMEMCGDPVVIAGRDKRMDDDVARRSDHRRGGPWTAPSAAVPQLDGGETGPRPRRSPFPEHPRVAGVEEARAQLPEQEGEQRDVDREQPDVQQPRGGREQRDGEHDERVEEPGRAAARASSCASGSRCGARAGRPRTCRSPPRRARRAAWRRLWRCRDACDRACAARGRRRSRRPGSTARRAAADARAPADARRRSARSASCAVCGELWATDSPAAARRAWGGVLGACRACLASPACRFGRAPAGRRLRERVRAIGRSILPSIYAGLDVRRRSGAGPGRTRGYRGQRARGPLRGGRVRGEAAREAALVRARAARGRARQPAAVAGARLLRAARRERRDLVRGVARGLGGDGRARRRGARGRAGRGRGRLRLLRGQRERVPELLLRSQRPARGRRGRSAGAHRPSAQGARRRGPAGAPAPAVAAAAAAHDRGRDGRGRQGPRRRPRGARAARLGGAPGVGLRARPGPPRGARDRARAAGSRGARRGGRRDRGPRRRLAGGPAVLLRRDAVPHGGAAGGAGDRVGRPPHRPHAAGRRRGGELLDPDARRGGGGGDRLRSGARRARARRATAARPRPPRGARAGADAGGADACPGGAGGAPARGPAPAAARDARRGSAAAGGRARADGAARAGARAQDAWPPSSTAAHGVRASSSAWRWRWRRTIRSARWSAATRWCSRRRASRSQAPRRREAQAAVRLRFADGAVAAEIDDGRERSGRERGAQLRDERGAGRGDHPPPGRRARPA